MKQSDPRDETLQTILSLDMDGAELKHLEQALHHLRSDKQLSQRLEALQRIREAMGVSQGPVDGPIGGPEAFQMRLIESISQTPACANLAARRPAFMGRFVAGFVGGMAAAMLIGFISTGWWHGADAGKSGSVSPVVDYSIWLPEDPDQQRALLTQLAGFYDGRAGWFATTGHDARMGLVDHPLDTSDPVVTRLSLEAPDGKVISTDLALFPGQNITVEAPQPDGTNVRYSIQVHSRRNGYNTMRLSLTVDMGDGSSMSTEIPLAGAPVREVGRLLTDRGEYELRLGLAGST